MASYMRKTASLSSSFFKLYGTERSGKPVRSCFLLWLSLRNMSATAAAELPPSPPSSLSSPLLLLPPEKVTDPNSNHKVFSLADNQMLKLPNRTLPEEISVPHCAGSSHGWLALVNGRECDFYLANILSPSVSPEIIQLPPVDTLLHVHRVLRDSSSNFVKEYHVYNVNDYKLYAETPDHLSWYLINRFAMSSAPNDGNGNNNDCMVMVSHGGQHNLSFCRIGDTFWTPLENRLKDMFMEIIFSKKDKRFYALTHGGYIEAWNLHHPICPALTPHCLELQSHDLSESEEEFLQDCMTNKYLVELSGGDILYVIRYRGFVGEDGTYVVAGDYPDDIQLPYRTARFQIYRLEFEKKIAEPVTSIGDSVLFLGYNQSFSLLASDYPYLKPNSIYFADDLRDFIYDETYPTGGHDVGVYNIEDHSVSPLYLPFEFKKIRQAPIWIFPGQ